MNLLKSTGFLLKSLYLYPFYPLNVRGDFRIFSNLLVFSQAFTGNFGKNVGKNQEFTNGLSAGYPQEFLLRIIELNVRVGVQRHADIAVSHDILQRLGIHPGLCHVGTESVPTHMGCDLGQLHTVGLVVLGNHMLHVLLPVERHHRHVVLVQAEETCMAVDHRLFPRFLPVLDDPAEAHSHLVGHRHIAHTLFRLRFLDHILHFACALKLMIHMDPVLVELDIRHCKTAKFGNAESCMEQDVEGIVILIVVLVLLHEVQEIPLLLPGDSLPGYRVIHNDRCQFKSKRILADQVIVNRQLKGRSQHPSDGMNGAIAFAVLLLQFDQPKLCVRKPNLINAKLTKEVVLQHVGHGLVTGFGVGTNTGLYRQIFLHQFQYGVVAAFGHDVVKKVGLDLPFFFPQRQFRLLTFRHPVILIQPPTVHIILLSVLIDIAVTIPPVSALILSFMENAIAIIASSFAHSVSFLQGEPDLRNNYSTNPALCTEK